MQGVLCVSQNIIRTGSPPPSKPIGKYIILSRFVTLKHAVEDKSVTNGDFFKLSRRNIGPGVYFYRKFLGAVSGSIRCLWSTIVLFPFFSKLCFLLETQVPFYPRANEQKTTSRDNERIFEDETVERRRNITHFLKQALSSC